jgi:aspartyl-tRNA synthetase
VVDFPLLEWDVETSRFYAMHHPFTSPNPTIWADGNQSGKVRANAYDLVINGVEIGGGSVRIHSEEVQKLMLSFGI